MKQAKNTNDINYILLRIILILLLLSNNKEFDEYINFLNRINIENKSVLKIFIMTHKDFKNYRYNPVYSIVANNRKLFKKKYNLDTFFVTEGKLYKKNRAYSEMSNIYYIYQLYKDGNITSKYIGLNHYRRYFNFTDNIPNIEDIFEKYDAILCEPENIYQNMIEQYCEMHICETYHEILEIIKEMKPEYYKTALNSSKEKKIYPCNLFIMRKNDFFKYCEFIFDLLFEFDKRKKFYSDEDVLNYAKKFFNDSNSYYQSRIEGFLSERISTIFFNQHFRRIKTFKIGNYNTTKYQRYSVFQPNIIFKKKMNFNISISSKEKKLALLIIIISITFFNQFLLNEYSKLIA